MEEIFRWLTGSGILAAFLWMAGKFYVKNVEGAIKEAKDAATEARNVAHSVSERVSTSLFRVAESQTNLAHIVTTQVQNMQKTWTETTQEIAKARLEAHDAQQAVIVLAKSTEENVTKLALGGQRLNMKIENTRTEVKELAKDVLLIKTRKGNT
jgi:hypothetical protein